MLLLQQGRKEKEIDTGAPSSRIQSIRLIPGRLEDQAVGNEFFLDIIVAIL
jgi:hypothetical protein